MGSVRKGLDIFHKETVRKFCRATGVICILSAHSNCYRQRQLQCLRAVPHLTTFPSNVIKCVLISLGNVNNWKCKWRNFDQLGVISKSVLSQEELQFVFRPSGNSL